NNVRTSFEHLVDRRHGNTGGFNSGGRTLGGNQVETDLRQVTRHVDGCLLVDFAYRNKRRALARQAIAGTQCRLAERLGKGGANAHYLTGGFHFRAEDRVDFRELVEREHRFLDVELLRNDFAGEVLVCQRSAGHAACRHLGQGCTNRLRHIRHGTRGTRVHLEHINVTVLDRKLHVHQADHAELQRHVLRLLAHHVLHIGGQRIRRQRTGGVTGVHAGLLDMLHDSTNHHLLAVADCVHVDFHRIIEETVEQYRRFIRDRYRILHVVTQLVFVVDDFHGATTEYIGRAHHQRITDLRRQLAAILDTACRAVRRLLQAELVDHLLETLAVFRFVNRIRAGTDNRHASGLQCACQFQRRLATVLHDHTLRLFLVDDFQHVLERYRLEVQAIGGVVIGGHGFRVTVDHDGLVTVFTHRQRGVHTAVIKFDALANAVRATTKHHDLITAARVRFALFIVGRVHVRGAGGKLRRTGIDALVHRADIPLVTSCPNVRFLDAQQRSQAYIGKALALEAIQGVLVERTEGAPRQRLLFANQVLDLHQEPVIDLGQLVQLFHRITGTERITEYPDAIR